MSLTSFLEPLQYPFMVRGLAAALTVGITGALIGSLLYVRRWALLGDAISHAVLPGVVIAYLMAWPYFVGGLATALLTAVSIGIVERHSRIKADAAMGIVFIGAFAAGLVVLSRIRSSVDVFHVLFGNILGISRADLFLILGVGAVAAGVVTALFKELQLWAFDPVAAQVAGLPVGVLHYLTLVLLAATIVAALQAVGIVLALAMLLTPPATAYLLTHRLPHMMAAAAAIGAGSAFFGLYASFYLDLASGPSIVLMATAAFAAAFLFAPGHGLVARAIQRRRSARRLKAGPAPQSHAPDQAAAEEEAPGGTGRQPSRLWMVAAAALAAPAALGALAAWGAAWAWGHEKEQPDSGTRRPLVVASTTIIADLARQVAGDRVRVHSLIGPGQDPHTYEPSPRDALAAAEADLILVNGYGLDFWAERLAPDARAQGRLVRLAEGVRTAVLPWPGGVGGVDPHLWMDPTLAAQYAEQIRDALTRLDPEGEALFRRNTQALLDRLRRLDAWIARQVASLPADRRKLVTTHDAYRYFGRRYGFVVLDTVWGISTEEEPSPRRMGQLFRQLREHGVPAFVETSVNPQIMQEIAAQAGMPLGGKLYADALGPPGSGAATYIEMMEHNVRTLVGALSLRPPREDLAPSR